ncbi:MAG: hypothetical protein US86_C0005G0015 [Candidatus Daviesbacteria bacterium GW2011_GWA2_38_24]|uniref:Uncharacterized protein n=1 Tax=Candidatus Daviesbacteria bacterium GW2011_GWA2_38_24 TaxID=1618422 RepID=A0A0G0LYE5_9BACT|nr:MAG: hypothetical protein US86_C0005G0015 [Candidatus Daviesbacteria bacterium GW2011_GWA2_38_24]OGE23600.1 MAG: hypothetical protein A2688_04785 [Candidatus Daviesbacteria bacterium RIFCSPHIGHO2_01_FULL_38_8]
MSEEKEVPQEAIQGTNQAIDDRELRPGYSKEFGPVGLKGWLENERAQKILDEDRKPDFQVKPPITIKPAPKTNFPFRPLGMSEKEWEEKTGKK